MTELPQAALPLGLPALPEMREQCVLDDAVLLHRIIRGAPLQPAAPLPCSSETSLASGLGGRADSRFPLGPYVVHVLEIAPERISGRLRAALAQGTVGGKATVVEIAAQAGALAAVNAGFFVVGSSGREATADGITCDPAGVMALEGRLISEAIRGRSAVHWRLSDPATVPVVT